MKHPNLFLFTTLIFIISCSSKKSTSDHDDKKEKKYKVLYNVFTPDSAAPNNYEVFSVSTDGTENKNITEHKDVAWVYYTFKNKVYFISDRDTSYRYYLLYSMDYDGKNIQKVTDLRLEDSWMSSRNNGQELIVSGRIDQQVRYQLFTINTTNGSYKQITNDTSAIFIDPVFSPDGKQIVCAYQKNKRDKSQHEELYIMNEDGSNMKQLTYYPENDSGKYTHQYKAGAPRWHPTENFISYISYQNGKNNIYGITPDGKKQWKLMDDTKQSGWHDWSSDGKWLVMDVLESNPKKYRIGLMNWQSKEFKYLTDTTYTYQQAPVFVEVE